MLTPFRLPRRLCGLLDDEQGGRFQIASVDTDSSSKQLYWPETNVLVTRFHGMSGVAELLDFMPAGLCSESPWYHQLIRRVRVMQGKMPCMGEKEASIRACFGSWKPSPGQDASIALNLKRHASCLNEC